MAFGMEIDMSTKYPLDPVPPKNPLEQGPISENQKLDMIFDAAARMMNLINVGKSAYRIYLIKFVREITGWGLAESKWYVDQQIGWPIKTSLGDILKEKMDEAYHSRPDPL